MSRHFWLFRTLFLVLLSVVAAIPSLAQVQDTTPPVLTGFTFSPMAVNTTNSPATVTVTMQITDDLSGVLTGGYLFFFSPSGNQINGCQGQLISGTNLNGTWQCQMTMPAYSEAGTWTVSSVYVRDNAGNTKTYYISDLQTLGFSTTLEVTSNQDTTPPVLTGFTFSPMAVNTTTSPATVTVTMQITDDISGVLTGGYLFFFSPSGNQINGCQGQLISGTNLNGTWQCQMTMPAYSEAGTWTVSSVYVRDNAGNTKTYYISDLQTLGFSTTLEVTSNQDTTPPVLTGFTFSPMAVNTTTSPATVTVTMQITDDISGVLTGGYLFFFSPSGNQINGCQGQLISGTNLNGTWQCQMTMPAYSEAGTWTVSSVYVRDNAGNNKTYYVSDLQTLGFSTTLLVDVASIMVTSSSNPSVSGQTVTFSATVTPQGPGTPTGTVTFSDGSTALGTSPLSGAIATLSTSALTVGPHTINAVYSGDSNFIGSSASLNQLIITPPPYKAFVQQPINSDGSSIFNAKRGVVPVKFTLTQNGMQTCALPAATISVTRTAGGTPGAIDEASYLSPADNGSNFRIDATACQYIYNLAAQSLGVGTYRVDININGSVVGSAVFALK